jgi:hypothetical protein
LVRIQQLNLDCPNTLAKFSLKRLDRSYCKTKRSALFVVVLHAAYDKITEPEQLRRENARLSGPC